MMQPATTAAAANFVYKRFLCTPTKQHTTRKLSDNRNSHLPCFFFVVLCCVLSLLSACLLPHQRQLKKLDIYVHLYVFSQHSFIAIFGIHSALHISFLSGLLPFSFTIPFCAFLYLLVPIFETSDSDSADVVCCSPTLNSFHDYKNIS
jgi:hypothetical protein